MRFALGFGERGARHHADLLPFIPHAGHSGHASSSWGLPRNATRAILPPSPFTLRVQAGTYGGDLRWGPSAILCCPFFEPLEGRALFTADQGSSMPRRPRAARSVGRMHRSRPPAHRPARRRSRPRPKPRDPGRRTIPPPVRMLC